MKKYNESFKYFDTFINNNRKPDFNNLLKVLSREKPSRPTLFEFSLNDSIVDGLTQRISYDESDPLYLIKKEIDAFRIAGYDYAIMMGSDFRFKKPSKRKSNMSTISLNEGVVITDRESFENYEWPDPEDYDYSRLEKLAGYLPENMKIIVRGLNGILEAVVSLVGYENLCYMLADDPDLVQDIFDAVGSRYLRYYEICAEFDTVGALISNDDWGFSNQTLLSANDLRQYVFPWHKKIVQAIHKKGKPALLHSCGMLDLVMDDIIDDMKYDAKHSFEDKIRPVEEAYEKYGNRIAILGGIDVDFICNKSPEEVFNRTAAMIELSETRGGYAVGSGNSIPSYVPTENYLAMISAAVFE